MTTIKFHIEKKIPAGEQLYLLGNIAKLGKGQADKALKMTGEKGRWSISIEYKGRQPLHYKYIVKNKKGEIVASETELRSCKTVDQETLQLQDSWADPADPQKFVQRSIFTDTIFQNKKRSKQEPSPAPKGKGVTVEFRITVPRVGPRQQLCIVGDGATLGNWDESRALMLDGSNYPLWQGVLKTQKNNLHYKYAIYDCDKQKVTIMEDGPKRRVKVAPQISSVIKNDDGFRFPSGYWRGAGVSVPVFSLRSQQGLGVGEFPDIKPLVDWAKKIGVKMVQLLPINDTTVTRTWTDSYPYSSISVFALNPIYLNLQAMGELPHKIVSAIIEEQRNFLNQKNALDYEKVLAIKWHFFKLIYDAKKKETFADPDYKQFFADNRSWLEPYGAFCFLRDIYHTSDFSRWGQYAEGSQQQIAEIVSPHSDHYDQVAIHYFLQYHLHKQMKDAADYAHQEGILLKGDIPIGINRQSVEAWAASELFHLDQQSGAPPDDFSVDGQNWGFPTYNWPAMAQDGYRWWKERLQGMAKYFDAFRIDHILGFFRIWEVPRNQVSGLMGHFNPAIPVTLDEFKKAGLAFDRHRFCDPYIRWHVIKEYLGYEAEKVAYQYLEEYQKGCYRFKPEFRTQRQIEEHLETPIDAPHEQKAYNDWLKKALFKLTSEVLFLEDPGSDGAKFHPRIALQRTYSFRDLPEEDQKKVDAIYQDYFFERHEEFWRQQAMAKLPVLKSATDMLLCGEDLGMLPDCVHGVMSDLELLSLRIQRMPKEIELEFADPSSYPYLSVCMPSSHDMPTIRGWWEEDRCRSQRFYNKALGYQGDVPYFCEPSICQDILNQHLRSPSMWAVIPLQEYLSIKHEVRRENPHEEWINDPSNPKNYWKYRLHITLEDLNRQHELNDTLKTMVAEAGRV
ncbi:MAG: 4-alpha-glucanotransferase [Chlamydiota bacterium]